MDPFALISGGAGGLTGPSSSAASDGTLSSSFSFKGGSNKGSELSQMITLGLVAVVAVLVYKRRR